MGVTPMVLLLKHPAARSAAHLMASVLTCSPARKIRKPPSSRELAARELFRVMTILCGWHALKKEFVAKKLIGGFLGWRR
jgi:hypothetical protein